MQKKQILLFFKATEYYHESIPSAVACLLRISKNLDWTATATEDSSIFDVNGDYGLAKYDVIVFVSNSGDLFTESEKLGLQKYVNECAGNILGLHGAIASFLNLVDHTGASQAKGTWEWYGELMGAYFSSHPPIQTGKVDMEIEKLKELNLLSLPKSFQHEDEWYNLDRDPSQNPNMTVLAWADESTYSGGMMGKSHPIIWYHYYGEKKSKVFYSALGHLDWHYTKWPEYQEFLQNALIWLVSK